MIELNVFKRDVEDSSEYLRSQGLVPAVMYGSTFDSMPVSVNDIEFRKVYREAGTSHLISTTGDVAGELCLVQDMQAHVVSGDLLHIDFKVVNKGEKTEVTIPVVLVGESPAKKNGVGLLNFAHEEVIVETLPSSIPESIEVDISGLVQIGDAIKLSDITLPKGVDLIDDVNTTLVSIVAPRAEESVEEESLVDTAMEPELVDQKGKADEEGAETKKEESAE
ncbi:50S ribosomal protein L25 [Patescibacteria group bacterium]|nr:50S ribosomal protein L25 [Patescibacteria group bacterium]